MFISFLFSKQMHEATNEIEPWNPHWVPKFQDNDKKESAA
jgi:hypothetical protein